MIPPVAHFIWYGATFPWVNLLSLRSAALRGGFERVVLHHEDELSATPWWSELERVPGFEARRIAAPEVFARSGADGARLAALYEVLDAPAARANVLRAALLAGEGGVYLDVDTVTVRSLDPFRSAGAFCGEEHVVFPATVMRSRNPAVWLKSAALVGARAVCRAAPGGWRWFRRLEPRYARAVNNAVLGAEPGHPFVVGLLEAMLRVPEERQRVRFALGTHLLQERVATYEGDGLRVCPPRAFFPLGPVVSQHWFRTASDLETTEVVGPDTYVAHWYASVENRRLTNAIDPAYVRRHAHHQLFSAVALPFV